MNKTYKKGLKKSFKNFCFHLWGTLGLPEPTPVQYDIADYLQEGPRRRQIEAFRGVGKSYLTAAFAVWLLWNNPQLKLFVVSAGEARATDFSNFVKSIINNNDFLHHLIADTKKGQRDSVSAFDVGPATPSGSPSVKSIGITGQLTGSRADIIIADDIETPKNSATHDLRAKLAKLVTEFDAVLKPDGQIIYLGTPQTELSLYNTLYKKGYDMRIWTARVPDEREADAHGAKLAPFVREMMKVKKAGSPVDPKRFDDEDLRERELSYGRTGFALQFQLDTSLSDALKFPLKTNDLIIAPVDMNKGPSEIYWTNSPLHRIKELPNMGMGGQYFYAPENTSSTREAYHYRILVIDPSGRGKDETSYAIGYMLNGNIFVPEIGGYLGGYEDKTLEALAECAKKHKVNSVLIESNFGDGMFSALLSPVLQRIYPVKIEEVRHNKQKELRIIDTIEPVLNQHRLVLAPEAVQSDYDTVMDRYNPEEAPSYSLIYQLTRLSKDKGALKHDDRLDCLAMLVAWFTNLLKNDQYQAAQRRKEEMFDKMLEDFINNHPEATGGRSNDLNLWKRQEKKRHK